MSDKTTPSMPRRNLMKLLKESGCEIHGHNVVQGDIIRGLAHLGPVIPGYKVYALCEIFGIAIPSQKSGPP